VSRRPQLFIVPYDSGHKGLRMGAGPLRLRAEIDLPATEIEDTADFQCENVTAFRLYRQLAARIAQHRDAMPVVFSGNCGAAIGTAAGIGIQDLGIIWFDAHGDFNTPETSPSGFLDGMALSILTGGCWTTAASSIPAFFPIDTDRVIHAGASSTSTSTSSIRATARRTRTRSRAACRLKKSAASSRSAAGNSRSLRSSSRPTTHRWTATAALPARRPQSPKQR
jgi:arginase